jgi:hypothetical protein
MEPHGVALMVADEVAEVFIAEPCPST